jgi:hypothetical protein
LRCKIKRSQTASKQTSQLQASVPTFTFQWRQAK